MSFKRASSACTHVAGLQFFGMGRAIQSALFFIARPSSIHNCFSEASCPFVCSLLVAREPLAARPFQRPGPSPPQPLRRCGARCSPVQSTIDSPPPINRHPCSLARSRSRSRPVLSQKPALLHLPRPRHLALRLRLDAGPAGRLQRRHKAGLGVRAHPAVLRLLQRPGGPALALGGMGLVRACCFRMISPRIVLVCTPECYFR